MGTHHRRPAASGARHSCWIRKHPRGPNSGEVLPIGLIACPCHVGCMSRASAMSADGTYGASWLMYQLFRSIHER